MCGGPEHSKPPLVRSCKMTLLDDDRAPKSSISWLEALKVGSGSAGSEGGATPVVDDSPPASTMVTPVDRRASMLEMAADNDLEAFRRAVETDGVHLDEGEPWYVRKAGTRLMAWETRTPVMVAALHGNVEIVAYILNFGGVDVNRVAGDDRVTALHCAAAGGSPRAAEVAELLLASGADRDARDAFGHRPADVLQTAPRIPRLKSALRMLLQSDARDGLSSCSSSPEDTFSPALSPSSPLSPSVDVCTTDGSTIGGTTDPASLPDIKNTIYTTDEFRMFSFKIRPCSRAYSHDWTECPFVHPGENARRRDPRKYHYSCVPCPDFRKGTCRRGDTCEYAHGVFECWLHPAQYRTRLCKEGTSCTRRVCFFAHTSEELRPLITSGSTMPSPRASSPLDVRSMSPPLSAASQSPVLKIPPFSPSASGSGFSTPPLSPSATGSWSQQANVPTLILPGSAGLHASRLRAALNARDIPLDDYARSSDYARTSDIDQLTSDFSSLTAQGRQPSSAAAVLLGSTGSRISKFGSLGLSIPPTNLQDLFSSEMSPMQDQLQSQLQLQQLLSPMGSIQGHVSPQLQSPGQSIFSGGSPHSFPTRRAEVDSVSDSLHARKAAAFAQRERGSWSMKDVGQAPGSMTSASWSDWGSPSGKPDWGVQGQELGSNKFRRSASFGVEPDLSWVQTLVKDGPSDAASMGAETSNQPDYDEAAADGYWDMSQPH